MDQVLPRSNLLGPVKQNNCLNTVSWFTLQGDPTRKSAGASTKGAGASRKTPGTAYQRTLFDWTCWRRLGSGLAKRDRKSDDSPRLKAQAGGFWNDAGVSSHTARSVSCSGADVPHRLHSGMAPVHRRCCLYPQERLTAEPLKQHAVGQVQKN